MTTDLAPRESDPAKDPATVYLAGLGPTARRAQATALRLIAAVLAPGVEPALVPWEALRYGHVVALRTWLLGRYAPGTANRMLGAVRGVVRAAWALGLVGTEDRLRVESVRGVPGSRLPAGRMLDPGEVLAFLVGCPAREAAMFAVLYGAGLRAAEACSLPVEAAVGDVLRVVGKGGKEREVPLDDWARGTLAAWVEVRGSKPGPLFPGPGGGPLHPNTLGSALERVCRGAGLLHVSPHDLRRTFVSTLLGSGMDIRLVGRLVGHDDPRTTGRYDRRPLKIAREGMRVLRPGSSSVEASSP